MSGNVKLALSHVVPDLVLKVLKGQDPLHILGAGDQVRHYTYGGDLAHGIRLAMESPAAVNDDFNLSTAASTTVLELAEAIWQRIHTDGRPFRYVSDPPFEHDVQLRVPGRAQGAPRSSASRRRPRSARCSTRSSRGSGRRRRPAGSDDRVGRGVDVAVGGGAVGVGGAAGRGPGGGGRPELSVVMPVFKEGESVEPVLRALTAAISRPHEILVVYDFDEDPTVPVIDRLSSELPAIRGLRNDLGRGVLNAMKAGIAGSAGPYVLVSMADGSDEPRVVDADGRSRPSTARTSCRPRATCAGGHQLGGPPLKRLMSRTAGLTLHWFAGVRPTTRRTTSSSTRAASSTPSTIESTAGFELALELTVKATIARRRVAEVPTTWRDRTAGESNFKLRKWLPHYLHWYRAAFVGEVAPAPPRPDLGRPRRRVRARSGCRRGSSPSTCSGSRAWIPRHRRPSLPARRLRLARRRRPVEGRPRRRSATRPGHTRSCSTRRRASCRSESPSCSGSLSACRGRSGGPSVHVPIWWIAFPPLVHSIWNGNPQTSSWRCSCSAGRPTAALAVLIKLYAAVPLLVRPKTLLVALRRRFLRPCPSCPGRLPAGRTWRVGTSGHGLERQCLADPHPGPADAGRALDPATRRRRMVRCAGAWPATQFYYVAMAFPAVVRRPIAGLDVCAARPPSCAPSS